MFYIQNSDKNMGSPIKLFLLKQEADPQFLIFTPQPLRAVGVLFSPMVSSWAGGGKSLSGLYLRNCKV